MITRWTTASIVNAGDGWHQHPTQALLDCYTIRTDLNRRDGFDGLRIAIVGDIKHSRVARSDVQAFTALGAHVTLVGAADAAAAVARRLAGRDLARPRRRPGRPRRALPACACNASGWTTRLLPSLREYSSMYGLTAERAARLRAARAGDAPGPDEPRRRDGRRPGRAARLGDPRPGHQRRRRADGRAVPPASARATT